MTKDLSVLIVEDDFLLAAYMVSIVEDAGGEVIGPAKSVASALLLLDAFDAPDAALLDINVLDGLVYPVADRLSEIGCQFAFVSSVRRVHVPNDFDHIDLIPKPANTAVVTKWLKAAKPMTAFEARTQSTE